MFHNRVKGTRTADDFTGDKIPDDAIPFDISSTSAKIESTSQKESTIHAPAKYTLQSICNCATGQKVY